MVARRLRWALVEATTLSLRSPTKGELVVKAAGWEVKAQADAKRAARQRTLIVETILLMEDV
jgi:hypothetical protein